MVGDSVRHRLWASLGGVFLIALGAGCAERVGNPGGSAGPGGGGAGGAGGGTDGGHSVWRPAPGTSWQWQLTGTIDTSFKVAMYDIDLFTTAPAIIDELHAQGRKVICYLSAGTYEPGRPDSADFPSSVIGNELADWPGEHWLDTRSAVVRNLMRRRLDLAVRKHCDGVEPDNVDSFENNPGFPLTAAAQVDYNRFLASEAHARQLSVGLKNDRDQVGDLLDSFDWALDEQCFQYSECKQLAPFIQAHKAVFEVEYGDQSLAAQVCALSNSDDFDTLVKQLDLGPSRIACR